MSVLLNEKIEEKYIITDSIENFISSDLNKLELCILKIQFKDLPNYKEIIDKNPKIDFWIASDDLTRENVLYANKFGIKNIIRSKIDKDAIMDYFNIDKSEYKITVTERHYSPLDGMRVMVVDDNAMNIELMKEVLDVLSMDCKYFLKSKEALEIATKEPFDLFLLDIMMPELSGYEFARRLKNTINKNSDIIFVSALSDNENKIEVYNLNSCGYIEKPFDIEVVRSQIYSIMRSKQLKQAISKAQETYFAMLTHDLKTPVNAEIMAIELLLNNQFGDLSNLQNEVMSDLLNSAKYMKSLTENILCKYKMDNNSFVINKSKNNIKKLIENALTEQKFIFSDKGQKVKITASKIPDFEFDKEEIKRVILNLAVNASENSERNSVITLNIKNQDNCVQVSFENNSAPIPLENPMDIFKKSISVANNKKKMNTGLGLYIVKNIVEAHGGSVFVRNSPNLPVKIGFSLPLS